MVCMADEPATECRVRDMTNGASNWKSVSIVVRPSMTVNDLFNDVAKEFRYDSDKFELVFQNRKDGDTMVILNEFKEKSISEIGLDFGADARNLLIIGELKSNSPRRKTAITNESSDDDLILGASASPTATESCNNLPPPGMLCSGDYSYSGSSGAVIHHDTIGYVGLVNQAMTCYLNSLLQALYMTPEFRNALYNWEFDGKDEVKSIPYQLQKLFLNLQTSNKIAVETTELTKSFGWDSSEAWQQHDIQELCRVMFDALEQKFKNTKQADLINRLYEGKMIDYVKCLECSTEKSREDTFLDIPLPVRPFGSTVAYGSIEEALRAFVLPETLDGNNQYFCEKCNKKCDAHKGLKFSKFPYLLTLHLKRFDFDYSTLHRIKLNDKVVFPDILNLNSFIPSGNKEETENDDSVVKCDDSSTTDSGSALDEDSCQGMDTITANNSTHEIDYQDDDEGIDVSGGVASNNHENEKNRRHAAEPGPYLYELFSIMIHSGSASGGHYYAYIKDFSKGEWFCFNDQSVTSITSDDIRKTYGGGLSRGYYSGAFSSSTNAYMLMYRQRDAERNCEAITVENFPPHIQDLLQKLKEREENERVSRENEMRMLKLHLYAYHPTNEQLLENTLYIFNYSTLEETTKEARKRLGLEELVSLENCRLVYFDRMQETIECSFEDREQDEIGDVISSLRTNTLKNDFLLEIKNENDEFFAYKPGGLSLKVYYVDIESEVIDGPATIRGNSSQTVGEYKKDVAKTLDLDPNTIKLVVEKFPGGPMLLDNDDRKLKQEGIYGACKIYVAKALDKDPDKPFIVSKLHEIIDQFEHVVALQVILPDVDKDTLESLAIPQLDMNHNADKIEHAAGETTVGTTDSPVFNRVSPLPAEAGSDQSNSEDSSLSDSDRTLVGDVPDEEGLAQLSISSMSPCVSSPEEGNKHEDNWDEFSIGQPVIFAKKKINYFKVTELTTENKQNRKTRILKALIDKRMNLATLKKELEPYVGVPMDYFKVYRQYMSSQEQECVKLSDDFKLFTDREKIGIKLGRALRNGEYAGKIFQLVLEDTSDPIKFLCDFFIAKGALVSDVKKGLLEELKRKCQLEIPYERCRLRKKSWKSPGKVCVDTERFETDINIGVNWELFVQELNEPETVTSSNQIVVFVRHWCPSLLELKPFKEVVLDKGTTEEFKQKISSMSAIPVENVETLRARGNFPSEMLVLSLHHDREWTSSCALTDKLYMDAFDDGHVYFFRDNREELKQLTSEELKELSNKETARMRRLGNTVSSTYSPRRERGLKIYLDSPKKEDDTEVD